MIKCNMIVKKDAIFRLLKKLRCYQAKLTNCLVLSFFLLNLTVKKQLKGTSRNGESFFNKTMEFLVFSMLNHIKSVKLLVTYEHIENFIVFS